MKLHVYNLGNGLFPLDWEFCFLTVDEYMEKIKQKYYENEEYNRRVASELSEIAAIIERTLEYAKRDFSDCFLGDEELRCPPMIFPIPKGDETNAAAFCIIMKRNEDGDTLVYSPIPLSHLEEWT